MLSEESFIVLVRVLACLRIMHEVSIEPSDIVIGEFFFDCSLLGVSENHKVMRYVFKPNIAKNLFEV